MCRDSCFLKSNVLTSLQGHSHPWQYFCTTATFSCDRQHLSYDCCLEVRGKIIRSVVYCIVYWSCAQSRAHLDELFSVDWVLLHWARFTVHRFICVYVRVFCVLSCHTAYVLYYCNTVGWTWWDWSLILEHLLSVLWHCWLGHVIPKNPSPIWPPTMCLSGGKRGDYRTVLCCIVYWKLCTVIST